MGGSRPAPRGGVKGSWFSRGARQVSGCSRALPTPGSGWGGRGGGTGGAFWEPRGRLFIWGWFVCLFAVWPLLYFDQALLPALGLIDLRGGQLGPSRETSALAGCGENNDRYRRNRREKANNSLPPHPPTPTPSACSHADGDAATPETWGCPGEAAGPDRPPGTPLGSRGERREAPGPHPVGSCSPRAARGKTPAPRWLCGQDASAPEGPEGTQGEEWPNSPPEADCLSVTEVSQAGQLRPASGQLSFQLCAWVLLPRNTGALPSAHFTGASMPPLWSWEVQPSLQDPFSVPTTVTWFPATPRSCPACTWGNSGHGVDLASLEQSRGLSKSQVVTWLVGEGWVKQLDTRTLPSLPGLDSSELILGLLWLGPLPLCDPALQGETENPPVNNW